MRATVRGAVKNDGVKNTQLFCMGRGSVLGNLRSAGRPSRHGMVFWRRDAPASETGNSLPRSCGLPRCKSGGELNLVAAPDRSWTGNGVTRFEAVSGVTYCIAFEGYYVTPTQPATVDLIPLPSSPPPNDN